MVKITGLIGRQAWQVTDAIFKEMLEIADRGRDNENESQARIQRDRLRVDTRKWMAARLAPKKIRLFARRRRSFTPS